ncbi:hypothetical protein [Methylophilus sp. 5]|uniref:hypothetical protein n=1 Tax=Methylophilus sp. 5 TaxID=1112274 RepID=UPI00048E4F84|nr:hypothetical protein [Methylophilus sp. 5]
MYKAFSNTKLFMMTYLTLVLPTYLADAGMIEHGSILYVLAMVGIWAICLSRGAIIGKRWLVLIPTVAFVFDLTPALAVISFVPYLYHLLAIVLGALCTSDAITHTDSYNTR